MNSQSHILMGALLFGRPAPRLAWVGAAGGLTPDLPMFIIVAGLRMTGYPVQEIFDRLYWEPWWQIANSIGHSFLLWGALTFGAFAVLSRRGSAGFPRAMSPTGGIAPLVLAFSGSALLHSLIDFLVHRDDAHMQFWPLSDWRFRSPVSYWDANHYGNWFGLFEALLGIGMAVLLFRRYRSLRLRVALVLAIALYAAVPVFFFFHHHGAS